uniref:CWC25 spliceosome associated protein homolog n=1 Tax=Neogobius melanostomus TaxID=47308 RepID=A0A8C6SMY7_9GOBI
MGGGDLNLKKSWHPQTMKNIERVWKAEQKHEAECKKIEELQKELKNERAREEMTRFAEETGAIRLKKDDRLDWMYQGPSGQVSRDEYLLGQTGPSAETGLLPGSIFNPNTAASGLDMAAKIREDPLFEIRKREEAKKREVLTNPVKMKKIKEMVMNNSKEGKERQKRQRQKKEKKHKRRSSSSSSDEDVRKHNQVYFENNELTVNGPICAFQLPAGRNHHTSASTNSHSSSRRERSHSRSPHRNHRDYHSSSSSNRSDGKDKPKAATLPKERYQRRNNNISKKLSADEMERKRREMMDQAKEREEDRENNVKRYKRQEEKEKHREQNTKRKAYVGFIHNMKLESAASSSLEDRVKRNIHSIQRTSVSQDHFMRR